MLPAQLFELPLSQYLLLREAAIRKREREMLFSAAMTANMMNATGALRHPVTARRLLGWNEPVQRYYSKAEKAVRLLKAMKKVTVEG